MCLKSHFTVSEAPEACSRGGLLSTQWAVLGCQQRMLLPEWSNAHPHLNTPAFVPWSPPHSKGTSKHHKTRVMTRQGFLHLVSACLHHTGVKPWECGSPCSRRGLPGWNQDFSYERQEAGKSSGKARCRIAIITHKRLQDFTHYTNSTEEGIRLIIPMKISL